MKIFLAMLFILPGLMVSAQKMGKGYDPGMRPEEYNYQKPDAAARAKMKTEQMRRDLSLAPEKAKQVYKVNLAFETELENKMNDSPEMTEYDRAVIAKIRSDHTAALEKVLEPEEWQLYKKKQKDREEAARVNRR